MTECEHSWKNIDRKKNMPGWIITKVTPYASFGESVMLYKCWKCGEEKIKTGDVTTISWFDDVKEKIEYG